MFRRIFQNLLSQGWRWLGSEKHLLLQRTQVTQHPMGLSAISNSSPRGFRALFWSLWVPHMNSNPPHLHPPQQALISLLLVSPSKPHFSFLKK